MDGLNAAHETWLTGQLKSGDIEAFKTIYREQFPHLLRFAFGIIRNKTAAEEITQETLTHLWEIRESLTITFSLKSYLMKAVRNKCIDYLRHRQIVERHAAAQHKELLLTQDITDEFIQFSQLQQALDKALETIPQEYADAFRKNRFEAKSYQEIAEEAGISVRTVEYHISKAIGLLRNKLGDFLVDSE